MSVIEQATQLLILAHKDVNAQAAILPMLTAEEAYLVQEQVMHALGFAFADIDCWKVGMSSLQAEPIFAPIYPDRVWQQGDRLPASNYRDLHVELEWGYRLSKSLTLDNLPGGLGELSDCFSAPLACFELVDSRLHCEQLNNNVAKLADNQITAGIVIGDPIEVALLNDPTFVAHKMICDEQLLSKNKGGHPLGHPGVGLLKGLKRLLENVDYLPAGTMILTGSWNGMTPVSHYSHITAHFAEQAKVSFQLYHD